MIYLDNAATTQVNDGVIKVIEESLRDNFGNPSSLYGIGLDSRKRLDRARGIMAKALGCLPQEVYFTACGTESNNLAILGAARARKAWGNNIVVSGFEHPAVMNTVMSLKDEGFEIRVISPDKNGHIDTEEFLRNIDKSTVLATCMRVNNEVGTIIDTASLAAQVKKINRRTAFHCDAVQAFTKHPTVLDGSIDTLSLSGHKFHGPKGIGALYVRKGFNLKVVQHGGGQESGLRSGTENIAYAEGMAEAVLEAGDMKKNLVRITSLRNLLRDAVSGIEGVVINSPEDASPYMFNFSLPGNRSETVLHYLEDRGVLVSSGSACGRGDRSHTLVAMGLDDNIIDGAIRVSFSTSTTEEDVAKAAEIIKAAAATLEKKA